MDTVFRSPTEAPKAESSVPSKPNGPTPSVTHVEVPYTDYEQQHSKPLSADYFELGDLWNDASGGFSKEVSKIEEYFTSKITSGELENNIESVKRELKKIEKMANTHKDQRKTVRLETVSAFIEFLMKSDNIKYNLKRYANT